MPLRTGTGRGIKLADAGNGRLTFTWDATGNPTFDDAQEETVFSLLLEPAGWFGDRARKRRTLVPTVRERDSSTAGRLVQYARDALQPALDDGRLRSAEPSVAPTATGYLLRVEYVTGSGRQSSVTLPLET